jgi:hypothetical protein
LNKLHAPPFIGTHFEQKKLHDPDIGTTYPCAACSNDTGAALLVSAVTTTVPSASSANNPKIKAIFVFIYFTPYKTVLHIISRNDYKSYLIFGILFLVFYPLSLFRTGWLVLTRANH